MQHGGRDLIRGVAFGCVATVTLYAATVAAQDTSIALVRPTIMGSRFDEDWRPLCYPAGQVSTLDQLKCIRLSAGGPTLTLGGEIRQRVEAVRNPAFGFDGMGRDEVLLHRVLLHADVRWAESARVFVQIGHHLATDRAFGRAPTDIDRIDLQQGFVDISTTLGTGVRGTLRAGRQEISLGASRLVSTREGANVRRSFDGARGFVTGAGWRLDAFMVRPVQLEPGLFDDGSNRGIAFWGLYGSGLDFVGQLGRVDLYYLGYQANEASFAQGTGRELRHTVGARLFGERSGFDWDVEAAYQFGRFGNLNIRAWTVASDSGFTFADMPWRPRIGLKANIASGDGNPADRRLGTFNALFPKFPYFTEANVVVPANIMDLQPSVTLAPTSNFDVAFGWNVIWKHRVSDAFYTPPLNAVPGTAGGGRFLGYQTSVGVTWQITPQLTLSGGYVRFWPGEGLRGPGGRSGDFLSVSAAFRF